EGSTGPPATKGITMYWLVKTVPTPFNPAFGGVKPKEVETSRGYNHRRSRDSKIEAAADLRAEGILWGLVLKKLPSPQLPRHYTEAEITSFHSETTHKPQAAIPEYKPEGEYTLENDISEHEAKSREKYPRRLFGSFLPDFNHGKVYEFPGYRVYSRLKTFLQNKLTFYVLGFEEKPRLKRRIRVAPGTNSVTREWLVKAVLPALCNPPIGSKDAEGMETSPGPDQKMEPENAGGDNSTLSFGIKEIPVAQGTPEYQSQEIHMAGNDRHHSFLGHRNRYRRQSPNRIYRRKKPTPEIEHTPKNDTSESETYAEMCQMEAPEELPVEQLKIAEILGEFLEAEESTNYDAIPDAINCVSDIQTPMVRIYYRLLSLAWRTVQLMIQILGIISLLIICIFSLRSYFRDADNSITTTHGTILSDFDGYPWANSKHKLHDPTTQVPPISSTGPVSQSSQDSPVQRYAGNKQIAFRPQFPISMILRAENSEAENTAHNRESGGTENLRKL
ncbi:hypothetical protein RUND412_007069, partial [Rhizina undulata]